MSSTSLTVQLASWPAEDVPHLVTPAVLTHLRVVGHEQSWARPLLSAGSQLRELDLSANLLTREWMTKTVPLIMAGCVNLRRIGLAHCEDEGAGMALVHDRAPSLPRESRGHYILIE